MATKLSVRALHLVLGLAAAWVLLFNVVPALAGPYTDIPYLQDRPVPNLVVTPGPGFTARMTSAEPDAGAGGPVLFPWTDTSDGTRDAATGLPPVELILGDEMHLYFWGTTTGDSLSFALPPLAWAALALSVLWLLWRIVRTVVRDEVFTEQNARRVAIVGVLVAAGGSAVQLGAFLLERSQVARSAAAGIVSAPFTFSFVPLLVGAMVALLAEVFRQGVRLRSEVDGLV